MLTEDALKALCASHDFQILADGQSVVCVIHLHTGFRVLGIAPGPMDPANWKFDVGCDIAYKKAFDQLWQLEAYRLTALAAEPTNDMTSLPIGSAVLQLVNEDGAVQTTGRFIGANTYDPTNAAHRVLGAVMNHWDAIIETANGPKEAYNELKNAQ